MEKFKLKSKINNVKIQTMLHVKCIQYFNSIKICPVQWKISRKGCVRWRCVFHERTNYKVKFNNRTGTEVPEGKWW